MKTIRLAMLGMIAGNGHPYSWSAIINGYDPAAMAECPYPVIPVYLGKQPLEEVRIPGAQVTHIWTDDPADAPKVARASKIPHVVARPEEVIGEVDAVIIATDDGSDHTRRARPFVEAGLPVFIDKPLATTRGELAQFVEWERNGARLLSSSGLRYAREYQPLCGKPWRWITACTLKNWEAYGIHSLEALYQIVGPGFLTARATCHGRDTVVHLTHQSGTQLSIGVLPEASGSFGQINAFGTTESASVATRDTYFAFRGQMVAIVEWLRSGTPPYPFRQTVEMMAVIIAGIESRENDGRPVAISSILANLQP